MFSFRFIYGVARQALTRPNTVVFTESTATKYFGNVDPVGQTITLNYDRPFEVTGVIEDVPHNSHLRFDFLLSVNTINAFRPGFVDSNWMARFLYTYVLVGLQVLFVKLKPDRFLGEKP